MPRRWRRPHSHYSSSSWSSHRPLACCSPHDGGRPRCPWCWLSVFVLAPPVGRTVASCLTLVHASPLQPAAAAAPATHSEGQAGCGRPARWWATTAPRRVLFDCVRVRMCVAGEGEGSGARANSVIDLALENTSCLQQQMGQGGVGGRRCQGGGAHAPQQETSYRTRAVCLDVRG